VIHTAQIGYTQAMLLICWVEDGRDRT